MPKPPENWVYGPIRGHRTRSAFRNTFAKGVLKMSECTPCNVFEDNCQGRVPVAGTTGFAFRG